MHNAVHNFITASGAASRYDAERSGPVLVVAGLAFEARIARACRGVEVLYGVGTALTDPTSPLGKQLAAAAAKASGIVSFGTAGGLDPRWIPGDCLLGTEVICERAQQSAGGLRRDVGSAWDHERYTGSDTQSGHDVSSDSAATSTGSPYSAASLYDTFATDAAWREALSRVLPQAHQVSLFGAQAPIASARDKASLFARSQAGAVDMESHHLARLAAQHGLPFAVCRVVIDHASQNVPPAALAGMSADGQTHILPILASLLRHPAQLPALLRLGKDAGHARRTMKAIGAKLPERFGLP